jgi:hypothetical protein
MKTELAEKHRLNEDKSGRQDWKRWGPYLSETPVGHRA